MGGKGSVAEVGFGDGAEAGGGAGGCEAAGFVGGHVGGVDDAPSGVEGGVVEEPLDGAAAAPGEGLCDFAGLLGCVEVDGGGGRERAGGGEGEDGGELFGCDGAQAVGGEAEVCVGEVAEGGATAVDDEGEEFGVADESALAVEWRRAAEAGVGVERGEERERDTRPPRRCRDAFGHLGGVGVGGACGVVVEVVELADAGEPGLEHLHVEVGCDGLDVVGGHGEGEAVHLRAPGPEVVAGGAAELGEARHGALEGVAVDVGHTGDEDLDALVSGAGGDVGLDGGDEACVEGDADVVLPAGGGESGGGVDGGHGAALGSVSAGRTCGVILGGMGTLHVGPPGAGAAPGDFGPRRVWRNARVATLEGRRRGLGEIEGGAVAAREGRIVFVGAEGEMPEEALRGAEVVDCEGRWILPGLIDCHTHLVHAGDRAGEFEQRLAGATYEEIALAGGGIVSSVRALRGASEEELVRQSLPRLDALMAEGVTTVEIKSGYGLDVASEVRSLRAARRLGELRRVSVVTTCLAAHAVPPEFAVDRVRYVDLIVREILPAVAQGKKHGRGLADAVDAFCEGIAFSPEEVRRVFAAAKALGLPVKLHADQRTNLGGAALAAEWGALSADHLEHTDEAGAAALGRAGTAAVLLPGAFHFLRDTHRPPVEAFRRHGVAMAVATDCNPGTSPLTSLLLAMNMGATLFGLTVEECIVGVTRAAARALGRGGEIGTLEVGKWADLSIWSVDRPAELVYRMGLNRLAGRVWHGE